MASLAEVALDRFVVVELAVDDKSKATILGDERLVGERIDEAQPRVAKGCPPAVGLPFAATVRAAVRERVGRPPESTRRQGPGRAIEGDDATHRVTRTPAARGTCDSRGARLDHSRTATGG